MLKLRTTSLDWALANILKFGDTDVLPVPFEFEAIQHDWDTVRNYIANEDVLTWIVRPHRALLAPKVRYGFRVVTQLDPLDSIVFAALLREIAEDIESRRVPQSQEVVYSYRVQITNDGQFFGYHPI